MSITTVRSQPTPTWVNNINKQQGQQNKQQQTKSKQTDKQQNNQQQTKTTKQPNKSSRQEESQQITKQQQSIKQSTSKEKELNIKEQQQIQKLRQRDSEVRQHELAHKTTGGRYAGNITYTYEEGPDGRRYAVGGSVSMNISAEPGEPQKTVEKAEQVRKAALAPAQPSAQDLKIAAKAARMKMEAKAKLQNPEANPEQQNNNNNQSNVTQIYNKQQQQSEKTQQQNISLIA